jgi:hypothetical protein
MTREEKIDAALLAVIAAAALALFAMVWRPGAVPHSHDGGKTFHVHPGTL